MNIDILSFCTCFKTELEQIGSTRQSNHAKTRITQSGKTYI